MSAINTGFIEVLDLDGEKGLPVLIMVSNITHVQTYSDTSDKAIINFTSGKKVVSKESFAKVKEKILNSLYPGYMEDEE